MRDATAPVIADDLTKLAAERAVYDRIESALLAACSHNGLPCTEGHMECVIPEMGCAETDDDQRPSAWARFLDWLMAPRVDLSK